MNTEKETPQIITVSKLTELYGKIKWLSKALSKDPRRPQLRCIYFDASEGGNALVATDGRRLHQVTLDDKTADQFSHKGQYEVKISAKEILMLKSSEPLPYPDWRHAFPSYDESTPACKVSATKHGLASIATATIGEAIAAQKLADDKNGPLAIPCYNDLFLSDALGLGTLFTTARGEVKWVLSSSDALSPLLLKSGNMTALVMPLTP